jgi:hypothetical protein
MTNPIKAGGEKPTPPTTDDLDAIHQRRIEDHADALIASEAAFNRAVAAAPELVIELRKVTDVLGK